MSLLYVMIDFLGIRLNLKKLNRVENNIFAITQLTGLNSLLKFITNFLIVAINS